MNSIHIRLEVFGTWCNDWPLLRVSVNDNIYFDDKVIDNKIIEFDAPLEDINSLVMQHYGKSFGNNGIWDTKSENNIIIQDRGIKLIKLEFDAVNIEKYVIKHWPYTTDDGESFATDYFGHNGQFNITFDRKVYNWIITTLVHDPVSSVYRAQDLIIETSHNDLFNYENDVKELKEISHLLEKYAHLFNKSS